MAEKVGSIVYDVSMDTSRMLDAERRIGKNLGRIGGEGDKLQARFTGIAAAISAALSAIAIEGVVSKIIAAQRSFDVMFASLKTMTGGADQAGKAFDRLRAFAAQTPFSLEQSVNGFVKLKALGLDPSERAMMSFGNTAAAMGKDLNQMIEAVADASTSEFERLKEFGIKAKQEGDKVSLTFQGVTTTIGNNAAEITEYLTKIGEVNFAGAMSERMKTLDGDISNLQDSLDGLYLSIAQSGFGEAVAAGVRKATEAIQEATTSIKQGGLTEYFDALKPYLAAAEVAVVALAGSIAAKLVASFVAMAVKAYAAATAVGAATVAAGAFSSVMAALGGPIGIAITALGLLALNWDSVAGKARDAATMSEEAAARIAAALRKSPSGATKELGAQLQEVRDEIAGIDKEMARTTFPMASKQDLAELAERRKTLVKIAQDIEAASGSVYGQGRRPANEGGGGMRKTPPPKTGGGTKPIGTPFDSAGYLAGLEKETLDGIARIEQQERVALEKNAKLLEEKKITAEQAARAITLIELNARQERQDIQMAEGEARRRMIEEDGKAEAALRQQLAQQQARGAQFAQDAIAGDDPIARLELRLMREKELLTQYALQDIENARLYAEAEVALEQETARRVAEIRQREVDIQQQNAAASVSIMADMTAQTYSILEEGGRERTALGKALFLVQKALAIAEILMNTEVAASKAGAQLGVFGIPMAALIRAQGYATAGMVAGQAIGQVAGGRQYGGPVNSGDLYRINEGGKPEMFTAANGDQYMMPTADGNVTPSSQVGQGGKPTVIQVTQHFHFQQAQDNRTMQQLGAAASRGISIAASRNN